MYILRPGEVLIPGHVTCTTGSVRSDVSKVSLVPRASRKGEYPCTQTVYNCVLFILYYQQLQLVARALLLKGRRQVTASTCFVWVCLCIQCICTSVSTARDAGAGQGGSASGGEKPPSGKLNNAQLVHTSQCVLAYGEISPPSILGKPFWL